MGTRLPFCIRRGAIYYWRRRLPSPSKISVEFSLGTKDERVARRLSSLLAIDGDRAFAVVREGGMTPEQAEAFTVQKLVKGEHVQRTAFRPAHPFWHSLRGCHKPLSPTLALPARTGYQGCSCPAGSSVP